MKLYAIPGGLLDCDLGLLTRGEPCGERVLTPINSYLIDHPRGKVLFDTGMNKGCITDPKGTWGKLAELFIPVYHQGEDIGSQLLRLGYPPEDIDYVVLSHLHFDHAGGIQEFPRSTFILQHAEREAARFPPPSQRGGYRKGDFDFPLNWWEIEGSLDLFDDGSIVTIPTPGHTPGHQSLMVRLPNCGTLLLVADACYFQEDWEQTRVPGVIWDLAQGEKSLQRLKQLAAMEKALVVLGHDPAVWATIRKAPDYYS